MENTQKISQKSKVESQQTQVENQETNSQALVKVDVIDQFYSALLSANESKERMEELHEDVELAVQELMRQQGKPKLWTGTIPYHGFKIVVSRPKSYTWEQNTNSVVTSDPNHAIYVQQLELQKRMNEQLKDMRADVKRTAEKLEKAHPDSESIKRGFRLAFVGNDSTKAKSEK